MKNLFLFGLTLLCGFQMQSQNTLRQTHDAFEGVSVNYGIEVELVKSDAYSSEASGSQKALDELDIRVEGSTLKVDFKKQTGLSGMRRDLGDVRVRVNVPTLDHVMANGGSKVISDAQWAAGDMRIMANGGSEIALELRAQDLELNANGGSEIRLEGNTQDLKAMANGGSELILQNLKATDVEVMANGGSMVRVHADKRLQVRANGGSDVKYSGSASNVDVRQNGSSNVVKG